MLRSITLLLCVGSVARAAEPDAAGVEFFEKSVRPILVEHCYSCHSADAKKSKGNLFLDTRAGWQKGGDTGPAIVPGKPNESLLVKAIRRGDETAMPPSKELPAEAVKTLVKWVEMGAPDPREGNVKIVGIDWSAAKQFWSFRPVVKPTSATTIDGFLNQALAAKNVQPVERAAKRTWIRRATFDLTGLPPTIAEIDAYLADASSNAEATVVDRLLASPAYGERWARYWLDVARYAEDQAHTFGVKPNTDAWRYRDWVIEAFNKDLPYDRFVKLQIAADLYADESEQSGRDRAALGFFGLGAIYYKSSNPAKAIAEELDDRIDTLTRGFLGLTVACARCHDHKFDPIPTQDYYSLAGVFNSTKMSQQPLVPTSQVKAYEDAKAKLVDVERKVKEMVKLGRRKMMPERTAEYGKMLVASWKFDRAKLANPKLKPADFAQANSLPTTFVLFVETLAKQGKLAVWADWKKLAPTAASPVEPPPAVVKEAERMQADALKKLDGVKDVAKDAHLGPLFGEKGPFSLEDDAWVARASATEKAAYEEAMRKKELIVSTMPPTPPLAPGISDATPGDMKVAVRGNPLKPGDVAPRRFLRVIAGENAPLFRAGSGRKELAETIASPTNPLTARVMVNRIWQNHFGRGLVGTASNFGTLGDKPTHPELLDYLAARFIESGWSVKAMHREIMLSNAYQRDSKPSSALLAADSENRLLGRFPRQRLEIEAYRDALLAVSGKLDRTMGGQTASLDNDANVRRTVYARISRHELSGLLRQFDFPDANIHAAERSETTVPQQQLFVLNSSFFLTQAKAFDARLQSEAKTADERIERAYLLAYGRPVTAAEKQIGLAYLAGKDTAEAKITRSERYAQALLGANEFLYVD